MRPQLIWGPLWGRLPKAINDRALLDRYDFVFYGGFNFLGPGSKDIIPELLQFQTAYPNTRFNMSRFEEYFLILAGLIPERSYSFQRWINPFSGILSAIEVLGLNYHDYFLNPENFGARLREHLVKLEQEQFYLALTSSEISIKALDRIEATIRSGEAYRTLTGYDEHGNPVVNEPFESNFLERYVEHTIKKINGFAKNEFN